MKPWDYQKLLRRSAEWIFRRGELLVKEGTVKDTDEFRWVPWVLTGENIDNAVTEVEKPMLSRRVARRVFDDLVARDLIEEREIQFQNGQQAVGWFVVNRSSWKQFFQDRDPIGIYIKPTVIVLWHHPIATLLAALMIYVAGTFLTPWIENFSEWSYQQLGLPTASDTKVAKPGGGANSDSTPVVPPAAPLE
jgi:hypothetical protein